MAVLFAGTVVFATVSVPNFGSLENRKIVESTKIYDREGKTLLYDIHGDVQRTVIPFEKIPDHVKNAAIVIEDQNFYRHMGVSPTGILRAVLVNLRLKEGVIGQGGSTLTQQLVKQSFLTPERSLIRKIREAILAVKTELTYSKDEILAFYLNEIPYGRNAYGIEAASQTYFAKPAEELTISDGAYLAAMLQAPTRYSPYGSHVDELEGRKNLVLDRMEEKGMITKEELEFAKNEETKFAAKTIAGIKAPHFSLFVREYLVEKYGEDVVEKGGLKVTTSLNWQWQEKMEKLVRVSAEQNQTNHRAYNAGMIVIDPNNGQILSLVGSRDYFADPLPLGCIPGRTCKFDPQVNMTLRSRQPGSSIKPIVYSAAFKKGYTPDTVLFDARTEFSTYCSPSGFPENGASEDKCYHPNNFDNIFRGPTSLRNALAQSVNVVAVKVLYLAGLNDTLKVAREMGITTLDDPDRYGLTLTLGGGEVKLMELANAYGVFADEGNYSAPTPILKVEDSEGNILEEFKEDKKQVMDPNIARMMSDVLSDNNARTPAFGADSALYIPERKVAVKTGTTQDTRDTWIIGFTPNVIVGVWAGNNDNSAMERRVAGLVVAPIWKKALQETILPDLPPEDFTAPEIPQRDKPILNGQWQGGRMYKIDKLSGKLANEFTPPEFIEERVITDVHTILHWVDKDDPLGDPPSNPWSDPQYRNWEASVRSWAENNGLGFPSEGEVPTETDDSHLPQNFPQAQIILDKETVPSGDRVTVKIETQSTYPIEQIDIFLNDEFKESLKNPPYEFRVRVTGNTGDEIKISAIVYDQVRNKTTIEKTFKISEN